MFTFLVDVNMPYYFSLWNSKQFIMQRDVNPTAADEEIWQNATNNDWVILTKDSDFTSRMLMQNPPPRVIQVRTGNLKMKAFHDFFKRIWPEVLELLDGHKLILVYNDRLEAIQ
jgi:predicted nuclease of predicted toxin-antitoxin system